MLSPPVDKDSSRFLDEVTEEYDSDELLTAEDEIGEEVAILSWLWTFPQVSESVEEKEFFRQWTSDATISRYVPCFL